MLNLIGCKQPILTLWYAWRTNARHHEVPSSSPSWTDGRPNRRRYPPLATRYRRNSSACYGRCRWESADSRTWKFSLKVIIDGLKRIGWNSWRKQMKQKFLLRWNLPRWVFPRAVVPESHRLHFTHVIGAAQQKDCDVTTLTDAVVATGQHVYVTLTATALQAKSKLMQ